MTRLANKTILITGGASGLGRSLAQQMAKRGGRIVIWDLNGERAEKTAEELREEGAAALAYRCDVSDKEDVYRVAADVKRDVGEVDVLVNNAGFGSAPDERWLSEDGHEFRFQVNYLAPFLLTNLLKERLIASAPSRIVNVSSIAQTPIDWDDVMIERDFSGGRAYGQSLSLIHI